MKTRIISLLVALVCGLSIKAASPSCGLTIITHGFQPNGTYLPPWVREMADAIKARTGANIPIYRVRYDKQSAGTTADDLIQLEDGASSIDMMSSGAAIILLDWAAASDETVEYPAQNVADLFFDYLFGQQHNGHYLVELPIHLIGHSRGASLNSRLAYSLAANGILVEQLTTLDPHPVRPWHVPPGNDWVPETFLNVVFADNYFQANDAPEGMSIAGTFNQNLSSVLTGIGIGEEHGHVHTYYHGTVDIAVGSGTEIDGDHIVTAWYDCTLPRDETGFNFGRYTNSLLARPASGVNQFISGAGGTGSRVSVDTAFQFWPNVGFDQRGTYPERVTVGQTVSIPYYYADRSSQQTITFFTDGDTNPFNGERANIGSVTQISRPAGSIGSTGFSWTPTAADVGTHYIRVKTTNTRVDLNRVRYDYYLKRITVEAATTAAPTISDVSPRTLNAMPVGQRQWITITGSGFNASSTLSFNDGTTTYPSNPAHLDYRSATEIRYNIAVGPDAATWTVKVISGAVESLPYTFYVVSGGVQLTALAVSGPALIAENGSGQFTATAQFSDGSAQNVTGSTTWGENSGATTISSSGLLSASSVGGDTAVTVSASYTAGGITRTANAGVTVVNSASCGIDVQERIVNGNFANNANNWTLTGSFQADARFAACASCPGYSYLANADGTGGNNLSGTLSQSITIPANATSATLGYNYRITSSDSTVTAFDFLSLNLVLPGGTLVGLDQRSNLHASGSYAFRSFDIIAYKGQTITVRFTATTDFGGPTTFRVDDVSVIVSVPNPVVPVLFGVGGPTSVAEGSTAQYNAIVVNCDGSIQSVSPSWSENSSATTISGSALLTVGNVGSDTPVTITATYGGFPALNYPITIVNSTSSFSYLAISGPSSINENSSGQFTATAIFSDGSSQSVSPSWSENSSATSISGSGQLTAGGVVSDTIMTVSASHTIGGVTRNANQDVLIVNVPTPPTLSSLSISGPSSVSENSTAQYAATASFSDGSTQGVNPTWGEDSSATSISIFGLLSAGEVAGDTPMTVSASYSFGGVTRSASLSVTVVNGVATPTFTLTVNASHGAVAKNPDQAAYTSGSQVVLTAAPANGYQFTHWSGDASGSLNPLTVTMSANTSITANFVAVPPVPHLGGFGVSNGVFRFVLRGPASGSFIIQASSNLMDWIPLGTFTIPVGGSLGLTDPMGGQGKRFYRALRQTEEPVVLQPGPTDSHDIWTTSVYSYAPGGGGPGGGLNDDRLRVGGWGDEYYSLLQFDLTGLPIKAASAVLYLYCHHQSGGGTPMFLDRITQSWDWQTQGTGSDFERLWWNDRPATTRWHEEPISNPAAGQWYAVNVTELYNAWQDGLYQNHGLQLRPAEYFNDDFNEFYSADYTNNPALRPKLVITPSPVITVQPGPLDSKDIWTTSVYSYAPSGGGSGGGLNDENLRVGGWGDEYYSLLQFDLAGLPTNAASAVLHLYCSSQSSGGTAMYLDRVTAFWDWRTQGTGLDRDRLWWADRPSTTLWFEGALPTPMAGQWYTVDITGLYRAWQSGSLPNHGLQFRPVEYFNNNFNQFRSADSTEQSLRPKLVVTP